MQPPDKQQETFAGWAILELMGHRRLGGYVQEATLAGGAFLRIDVPGDGNGVGDSTQFYSPGSVYCMTPTTEETARLVADMSRPAPVHRWELPPRPQEAVRPVYAPVEEDEQDYNDSDDDE